MAVQDQNRERPTAGAAPKETNRARVRRLFIDPLTRQGMRFERATSDRDQRRKLDQMADDLAYLEDAALVDLEVCMRTKGEGSRKVFWPSRVSIVGWAEARQPRPLEETPGMVGWFASAAGRKAADVPGRLVAEFGFWTRHKRPPLGDREWGMVRRKAEEYAHRAALIAERLGREAPVPDADRVWYDRFCATQTKVEGWLRPCGGAQ